ncbi:MAG TPA: prolipoprotein diacylglyceryl transferase [Solirubrobacteraceae bacterium]|nr:prolipoprotein diacylglyceryl transferase [Solirubrobacteraceae bacterium]
MNLLASIPSPAENGFHIGPLFFHAYGIAYVFAVAAAILVSRWGWRRKGGDPDLVYEVAMWGFPAGLIGGRIYFIITTPSQVPPHWWGVFAIWQGGLGIWGGVAGGALAGLWVLNRRLTRSELRVFMDVAAPGLLVAQAIGRIGNYFNQELFGKPTSLPWGLEISPAHRPPGFGQYTTFQPTFLYEMIWNLALAALLVWLCQRRKVRAPGCFALYVAGYSAFRMFEETLRIDYSNHILGLRLNFFVALALCLAGLLWFVAIQRSWRGFGGPPGIEHQPVSPGAGRTPPASRRGAGRVGAPASEPAQEGPRLRPQPSGRRGRKSS